MQCTEAGVVIALRRRVERMLILHERKESCLKSPSKMASLVVTEKVCCQSCVSSAGASAFIESLGFKRILVRSDNERSLLSLIERVRCNLTGVELVLMTSPEGDHQANGLAEVGVREIKAQTSILRSQLEQRLGS